MTLVKDLVDFHARHARGHIEAAFHAFEWKRDSGLFEPRDEAEGSSSSDTGLGRDRFDHRPLSRPTDPIDE